MHEPHAKQELPMSLMSSILAVARLRRGPTFGLVDHILLADGRSVTVRPVLPSDFEAERRFVVELSPQSRHRRFHIGIATLPDAMLQSFTHIDYRSHVALVAVAGDGTAPGLVADARYALLDDVAHAEFAIAVADDWQGIGLGRELLIRLGTHARRSGLRRLYGDILRDNAPMIGLVRSLGGRVRSHPDDRSAMRAIFDL
jgi:acetyltransferase